MAQGLPVGMPHVEGSFERDPCKEPLCIWKQGPGRPPRYCKTVRFRHLWRFFCPELPKSLDEGMFIPAVILRAPHDLRHIPSFSGFGRSGLTRSLGPAARRAPIEVVLAA